MLTCCFCGLYSLQNKVFVLLDIWSSDLATFAGPMEILLDHTVVCLLSTVILCRFLPNIQASLDETFVGQALGPTLVLKTAWPNCWSLLNKYV